MIILVASCVAAYFTTFHGEYHSSQYQDGMRSIEDQYFCGWKLWERRGSEPPGLPEVPLDPRAVMGKAQFWRGFGVLWRRTYYYR